MKIRNVLFSATICLMLAGPAALFCMHSVAKVPLPGWLTSEDAAYLSGGSEKSAEGIRGLLESGIEGNIPFKAFAFLGNAATQRVFIESSNLLFDWECFPTYYGSDRVYVPRFNALGTMQGDAAEEWAGGMRAFSSKLSEFAHNHLDVEFHVIVPELDRTAKVSPIADLTSDYIDTQDLVELMKGECGQADNVEIVSKSYSSYAAFLHDYYSTDMHWNGYGAINAFNEAMNQGGPAYHALGEIEMGGDYFYNGDIARAGLMLLDERIAEPRMVTSGLSTGQDQGYLLLKDGTVQMAESGIYGEYNFYSLWYGGDRAMCIASDNSENGNALVVSDSFGESFRWVVADNYSETHSVMDLRGNSVGSETLADCLVLSKAKEVFFVATPPDYSTFLVRRPRYFS